MAANPDQGLPDRSDLRNEMSRVPFFFFSLITLATFAGGVYEYLVVKDTETGKMLFIAGVVLAAFTLIYNWVTSRISKKEA